MGKISAASIFKIASGLEKYQYIMHKLHKTDVSADAELQRNFNGFYRVRQRDKGFYQCYYGYMEKQKDNTELTFREVLLYLYEHTGRMEASFSSKLLATIRPEMPIWDAMVLKNLSLKAPATYAKGRLDKIVELYDSICRWYQSSKAQECAEQFERLFPGTDLTATKKADFILWQTRGE